jgi:ABC-type multidrug transport system fused ATPase/permease subunit
MGKESIVRIALKKSYLFIMYIITTYILVNIIVVGTDMIAKSIDNMIAGEKVNIQTILPKLLIMIILGMILSYIKQYSGELFSIYIQKQYKDMASSRIVKLEYSYFEKQATGGILTKLISDIDEAGRFFSEIVLDIIQGLITIITVGIYIFTIDYKLILGVALCYPLVFLITNIIAKKIVSLAQKRRNTMDSLVDIAGDCIAGISIGRCYKLFDVLIKRMEDAVDSILKTEYERSKINATSEVLKNLLSWIPNITCSVIALFAVIRGDITIGEMMSFAVMLNRIVDPMSSIPFIINDAREAMVSIKRLNEILNVPMEKSGELKISLNEVQDSIIEFKDITFSYENNAERKILNKLNMSIHNGKVTAIVGGSGAGKTTLYKLICGFHSAQSGVYKLYGTEFSQWNLEEARKHISLVSQNIFLFPGTVAENIAFGMKEIDINSIINACKMANINEFIEALPEKYNTVVGERGAKISGGERQRISIARAILKNAPILLMDEPTSAVDMMTEKLIQEAIDRVSAQRTVIIIAHRLSTIESADNIYVLNEGKVIENGTHEQLLEDNGYYASLYMKEKLAVS